MASFFCLYIHFQAKTQTKTSLSSVFHDSSHQSNDLKSLEVIKKALGRTRI